MNVAGAWKFHVSSRLRALIIPLVILLMASVFWNLYQHRVIEQDRTATQQKEIAAVQKEAERAEARRKKNAEWAASDARVQQLYREINNLSEINERLLSQPQRSAPKKTNDLGDIDGLP
jgi:uncharacterized membrane protein (DUF106 family)